MRTHKILWAEDVAEQFEFYRTILENILKTQGLPYELMRAEDGNAVYKHLTPKVSIDMLIVDIEMPRFNGLEVARDVGRKFEGLPILVVSANVQKMEVARELEKLLSEGVIAGYFHSEDVRGWGEAIARLIKSSSVTILHLSDIHFGRFYGFQKVSAQLEDLICTQVAPLLGSSKVDLLAVSGDFCSEGRASEFDRAMDFLEKIANSLSVRREKVVMVPGNHDIFRGEEASRRYRKFLEFLNAFYATSPSSLVRYPELYNSDLRRLREEVSKDESLDDLLYCISVYDELGLIVIGLNSVISADAKWDRGDISGAQLLKVEAELGKLKAPRAEYFRIAIFHHHLFEIPNIYSTDESERVVANQGLILRHLIRHGVRLVLHGHSHYAAGYKYQPLFFDDSRRDPILVFSAGTLSGSHRSSAQDSYQCSVLRLLRDGSSIARGMVTPLRLRDDMLEWQVFPAVEFDLI